MYLAQFKLLTICSYKHLNKIYTICCIACILKLFNLKKSSRPMGFPGSANGKEPTCQQCSFNPWVRKIPWRRVWPSTPVFLPDKSQWTEEPGKLQSIVLQRVGHDWIHIHQTHKLIDYLRYSIRHTHTF